MLELKENGMCLSSSQWHPPEKIINKKKYPTPSNCRTLQDCHNLPSRGRNLGIACPGPVLSFQLLGLRVPGEKNADASRPERIAKFSPKENVAAGDEQTFRKIGT